MLVQEHEPYAFPPNSNTLKQQQLKQPGQTCNQPSQACLPAAAQPASLARSTRKQQQGRGVDSGPPVPVTAAAML